jgi:hypothetical protein
MRSVVHDAPNATSVNPYSAPAATPETESSPAATSNGLSIWMMPVVMLCTGFSLVRIGVPLWIAVAIVLAATTFGLVRRANEAS